MRAFIVCVPRVRGVNTGFGIIRNPLFEKVGLSLERDHVHEVERVCHVVYFLVTERDEQAICDEFDVPTHQCRVHPDQVYRESVC